MCKQSDQTFRNGTRLAHRACARPCANRESVDHPTAPDRKSDTAYVIGGRDLLELESSLESLSPVKVIYHSHPNGRAYLSETDKTVATSPWGDGPSYPVQQLVVGVHNGVAHEAALFGWEPERGGYVELRRSERDDLAFVG